MSTVKKHDIYELLTKPKSDPNIHLDLVKKKLEEIAEQTKLAKAFPVALLDSQKLEQIIFQVGESYHAALESVLAALQKQENPQLTEAMLVFRQAEDKFQQVLDSVVDIAFYVRKLDGNAELERQVLQRIMQELG